MHIYEYLFVTIVIVTMLFAASTMISTVPQSSITVSGREQLKTVAQRLMIELILNTGNPPNWGSDINLTPNLLSSFGLAKYGEKVREAYVLDPDKVQRLSSANPLYIQPSVVLGLLNLGRDYGLTIGFTPAFDVEVSRLESNYYEIGVFSEQNNLPIVNANVTSKIVYFDVIQKIMKATPLKMNSTDASGKCTLVFDSSEVPQNSNNILVAVVDYYGIQFTKIYVPSETNATRAFIVGNYLILSSPQNITGNLTEVFVLKSYNGYIIDFVESRLGKVNSTLYNSSFVEPTAVVFMTVPENSNNLIIAWKDVPKRYSSLPEITSLPFAYSLERNVIISGSSYTLTLQVWRMAW